MNEDELAKQIDPENYLIREFAGKHGKSALDSNVNWTSALLCDLIGPVWFFGRKSYLLGFGLIALSYLIAFISELIGVEQGYYIMFFVYLFATNPLYRWDVKRKIRKYKAKGLTDEEIIKKGGASLLNEIIYLVIFIIFLYVLVTTTGDSIQY